MTKEQYLAAVRTADGIREEEEIINSLEEMLNHDGDLEVKMVKGSVDWRDDGATIYEQEISLDDEDLKTLIDKHKGKIKQYEKDFIAI